MSEFKGTPGPWMVGCSSPTRAEVNTANSSIADVWNLHRDVNHVANAHLIAAAPGLLDELVEADKTLCALQSNVADAQKREPRWEGVWQEIQSRRDSIRTAIDKALNTDTKGEGHE